MIGGADVLSENAAVNIRSLAHVCIKTTNLEETIRFYCKGLGMERRFRFMRGGKMIGVYLKAANETFIEVFETDAAEKLGKQVLNHFCLQSEEIGGLRERLIEKGYAPGEMKMGADGSWQFWMEDPNGLAIEFQEYTERSSQVTGADVEI